MHRGANITTAVLILPPRCKHSTLCLFVTNLWRDMALTSPYLPLLIENCDIDDAIIDHPAILNTGNHSVVVVGRDIIISRPATPHMGHVLLSLIHSGFGSGRGKARRVDWVLGCYLVQHVTQQSQLQNTPFKIRRIILLP